MLHAFSPKNHETQFKISADQSWTTLHCQNDRLGTPDGTYEESIASCCLLPTCSMLAKSVTVSVAVWKMGVVLRQAWSKSQWTVLMRHLTISTQMLDSIKHITYDNFFFQEDSALVHCACNTAQLGEKCDFRVSRFASLCRSTSYLRWHSKASFDCLLYR